MRKPSFPRTSGADTDARRQSSVARTGGEPWIPEVSCCSPEPRRGLKLGRRVGGPVPQGQEGCSLWSVAIDVCSFGELRLEAFKPLQGRELRFFKWKPLKRAPARAVTARV